VTAPDVIKLDRSIAAGVATDRVLATLVGSLATFAHGSGARVVAEGVETAEDATALRALGVDYGQGWHFGRPGPPEALALPVPGRRPTCGPPRRSAADGAPPYAAPSAPAPPPRPDGRCTAARSPRLLGG
ncbi:MAG: EAL domain-containing protein, partial [Actinomycetota bacterium]|nr:EAL domain-containing protein [Actinomycetota bacterium]